MRETIIDRNRTASVGSWSADRGGRLRLSNASGIHTTRPGSEHTDYGVRRLTTK